MLPYLQHISNVSKVTIARSSNDFVPGTCKAPSRVKRELMDFDGELSNNVEDSCFQCNGNMFDAKKFKRDVTTLESEEDILLRSYGSKLR